VYSNLNQRIENLRFRSNFDQLKWDKAAREHADMVEALEARDGVRLGAILRHHLQEKCQAVLDGRRAEREALNAEAAA
jgi:DNA-binding GntR family transcriptional regulator